MVQILELPIIVSQAKYVLKVKKINSAILNIYELYIIIGLMNPIAFFSYIFMNVRDAIYELKIHFNRT